VLEPYIPPGMASIVQMNSASSLVLSSTVLSNPISLGTLDSANIDTAVVVLEAGCAAGRNTGTGIEGTGQNAETDCGGTSIGGGTMTMDELG